MKRLQQSGFTLIELMTVVAIVGVLLMLAYPNYRENVDNSDRALARTGLVSLSGSLEQYYAENNSYLGATMTNIAHPTTVPLNTGDRAVYTLNFSVTDNGGTYTAVATPIIAATGSRTVYSLSSIGTRKSGPIGSLGLGWNN